LVVDTQNLLVWLIVGLIAGFLAAKVMTGHGFGIIGDIVVGILGAILGSIIAGALGFVAGGLLGEIIVAFVGAVILLMILRLLRLGSRRRVL
jgi:uncharacterized membrane protein YeaQ/YmgE (transglycosylase-associated protein family)